MEFRQGAAAAAKAIEKYGTGCSGSRYLTGTLDLHNTGGTGTLGLQLFMASDSAGTYSPSAAVLTVTSKTVMGTQVVPDTVQGKLLSNADSLFAKTQLWVRVAAHGANASLVTPVTGTMVLTSLMLSVFINDKIF